MAPKLTITIRIPDGWDELEQRLQEIERKIRIRRRWRDLKRRAWLLTLFIVLVSIWVKI